MARKRRGDDSSEMEGTAPPKVAESSLSVEVECSNCQTKFTGNDSPRVEKIGVASFDAQCPRCGAQNRYLASIDMLTTRCLPKNAGDTSGLIHPAPPAEEPESVTACWNAEKISPLKYNSYETPSFYFKTHVRAGETPEQAFERAYAVVERFGERARERKHQSFVNFLKAKLVEGA